MALSVPLLTYVLTAPFVAAPLPLEAPYQGILWASPLKHNQRSSTRLQGLPGQVGGHRQRKGREQGAFGFETDKASPPQWNQQIKPLLYPQNLRRQFDSPLLLLRRRLPR